MFGVIDDESEPGSWAEAIRMRNEMMGKNAGAGGDVVNSPEHYRQGGIEAIEAIAASMTREEYKGYLKGNCMKYLWRYRNKGKPAEDLRKAKWYLDRLINLAMVDE